MLTPLGLRVQLQNFYKQVQNPENIMEGVISNYRGGKHSQHPSQMIVIVDGVDSKEKAAELVGKKAVWTSPAGKEIKGEIKAAHGNSGALRVAFENGMPGQSLATKVKIE